MNNRLGLAVLLILCVLTAIGVWGIWKVQTQLEANFLRGLTQEFYSEKVYRDMQSAIDRCEPLYNNWGGRFSFDEINRYLGFFDDLGHFWKRGVITPESIEQVFGYALIEAAEYPEIKRYIAGIRLNAKENLALVEFEDLANYIRRDPKKKEFIENLRIACKMKKQ